MSVVVCGRRTPTSLALAAASPVCVASAATPPPDGSSPSSRFLSSLFHLRQTRRKERVGASDMYFQSVAAPFTPLVTGLRMLVEWKRNPVAFGEQRELVGCFFFLFFFVFNRRSQTQWGKRSHWTRNFFFFFFLIKKYSLLTNL